MNKTTFANFWFPDFIGIAYGSDGKNLLVCPYFDDKKKAEYVYEQISDWNPNFVRMRFIEYGNNEYAFVAYQNPQGSFDKINFGLYRSSMDRLANYSQYRNQINSSSKLAIMFTTNPSIPSTYSIIGNPLQVSDCRIINESELENYVIEKAAHETCRK